MDMLLDDFARLDWGPPHLILEIVEHHVEEIEVLHPLDARFMERMPSIDAREFALPFRIDQVLVEGSEDYVDAPEDTRHWPEDFQGLDYIGVREHYERNLVEPEEDLDDDLEVEADASTVEADEITADNKAPPSLAAAKPLDPMTPNSVLFEGIIRGGSHIATMGVQDGAPSLHWLLVPLLSLASSKLAPKFEPKFSSSSIPYLALSSLLWSFSHRV